MILTAPPSQVTLARRYPATVALMAYRLASGPRLLRSTVPHTQSGGFMWADDWGFRSGGDPQYLCREVVRECSERGFGGMIADFEGKDACGSRSLLGALDETMEQKHLKLLTSERCGSATRHAGVVISSALSGGTLKTRLKEASDRFGQERVVLGVERVAEDFSLPSPNGQRVALTRQQLQTLLSRRPPTYFSTELCAHYFTYQAPDSSVHFVLFDNAGSIRRKLLLAKSMGIRRAMLAYPEVDDLLPELTARPLS